MGGKQFGFGDYEQSTAKKRTRRERFLAEMEEVVPWSALIDLIEPHYPKNSSDGGRPPYPLETMLRIHLMQQWYDLSDPAMEDALIEVATMRRFAGIALEVDWFFWTGPIVNLPGGAPPLKGDPTHEQTTYPQP